MNSHQVKRRNLPEGAVGRVSVPCKTNPEILLFLNQLIMLLLFYNMKKAQAKDI